ncbi:MAG: hypothetical protein ACAI44_04120 [Candidatus Sericytochromatia bacterium]
MEKSKFTRHLEKCLAAEPAPPVQAVKFKLKKLNELSKPRKAIGPAKAFLLEIKDGPYWIYVLARADASLADLDDFLRDLWLECCDHLSAFKIAGKRFRGSAFDQLDMGVRLDKVLSPKLGFDYQYDFGSTTHLKGKVVKELETSRPEKVRLLARNADLEQACSECGKPATEVCTECLWNDAGWLCAACAPEHACGEDRLLSVVNSPRCGVCGYTG